MKFSAEWMYSRMELWQSVERLYRNGGNSVNTAHPYITLIGMTASGKSKIGKRLAELLEYRLVDIDDLMVERDGAKCLQQIVDRLTPQEFADLEAKTAIRVVTGLNKPTVIATGGSMVYYEPAMRALHENTRVIHLYASFETIERRVAKNPDRGIVFAPGETLKTLYDRRMPMYDRWAHESVCTDERRKEVAKELAKRLRA